MIRLGFIDHFIDDWHADNFPRMIRESPMGARFRVAMAWAETDPPGKVTLEEWCRREGVARARTIDEVVAACDALLVLSPAAPERHEALVERPLRAGKPVFVDKPFATTLASARRMFELSARHGSPLMSTSALRYCPALVSALAGPLKGRPRLSAAAWGQGAYDTYIAHPLEMLAALLGPGATRVLCAANEASASLVVEYADGRRGLAWLAPGVEFGFHAAPGPAPKPEDGVVGDCRDGFWPGFIDALLGFCESGRSPVPPAETLEVAAVYEAALAARRDPDRWVDVPQ